MWTRLLEDPWPAAVCGLLVMATCAAGWFVSGTRAWLAGVAIAAGIMLGLIIIERLVVTDREELEPLFLQAAADLAAGDAPAVLAFVDPAQMVLRNRIRQELQRARITDLRITRLRIEVDTNQTPKTATAEVEASVGIKDRSGALPFDQILPRATVKLHKPADTWFITSFEPHRRRPGP